MSDKRSGAFIGGMLLGAAIGTITGLLIAPRTGRETRHLLKKSAEALPDLAEDLSTTVQLQADRLSESALKNWDDTLTRLKEAISAGIEAGAQESKAFERTEAAAPSEKNSSPDPEELYSNSYGSGTTVASQDITPT
ncbi:YtxH domain-containing protein [Planktothrix sp. FACHB-1355]|uniref:YtxH domain-containing protein n=1 Tax=Aerosakkonema funiforme FACHB-1375 TaxID=2949571 RepID=A0A926ZKE5_9CYAN|nr:MULTISPECIES: YtxH domain-containing protein [Oscillatoriales]MBD2185855.1 YtxH domain-containing protein [Aerosakkonema funiforme FACHB-1375]MBD3560130.1 YtxH domain-containing protein [Planktothrix sp. FACHB-1355]